MFSVGRVLEGKEKSASRHGAVVEPRKVVGYPAALDRLAAYVYDELRRMARRYMGKERAGNTLQATALVNGGWVPYDANSISVSSWGRVHTGLTMTKE